MRRRTLIAFSAVLILGGCAPRTADTAAFQGRLSGLAQVPPTAARGTATASVTLDKPTRTVTYSIAYADLTGPATMIHFHSPADPDANSGIRVALTGLQTSPLTGHFTLTQVEMDELLAGKWYVNIHTEANPAGEIRGQLILQ